MSEEDLETIRRLPTPARPQPRRPAGTQRVAGPQGQRGPAIAQERQRTPTTVRSWRTRVTRQGVPGLAEPPWPSRPATYRPAQVSAVSATALTDPTPLSLPVACWTLERWQADRPEVKGLGSKRTRLAERLRAEGWRWRQQEPWCGVRVDPACAPKRGASPRSTRRRPPQSVVVCLDAMGPESVKRVPGQALVPIDAPAARAPQRGRLPRQRGMGGSRHAPGGLAWGGEPQRPGHARER